MPDMLYVGLQDDDKIAVFALNGDSGELTKRGDVAAAGGPSVRWVAGSEVTVYRVDGAGEKPRGASRRLSDIT